LDREYCDLLVPFSQFFDQSVSKFGEKIDLDTVILVSNKDIREIVSRRCGGEPLKFHRKTMKSTRKSGLWSVRVWVMGSAGGIVLLPVI
jgi:hypothetical protein